MESEIVAGWVHELTFWDVFAILLAIGGAFWFFILRRRKSDDYMPPIPLEPMKKQDMTVQQLRDFDGVHTERVLIAVDGKIFDVTRAKHLYGPGGPYGLFAGRDASRGLATFSIGAVRPDYDDLSDLSLSDLESMKEWAAQFQEKYPVIGRLLKPGEQPESYSDTEEDTSESGSAGAGSGGGGFSKKVM